jgi:hypothetical protein
VNAPIYLRERIAVGCLIFMSSALAIKGSTGGQEYIGNVNACENWLEMESKLMQYSLGNTYALGVWYI